MIRATTRPTVPTALLLALLVAVTAFIALAELAGAEQGAPYQSASQTPASFAKSCGLVDGVLIEDEGANGGIAKSTCRYGKDGEYRTECDWVKKTCTNTYPDLQPGIDDGGVGGPVDGGVLDEPAEPTRPGLDDVAAPSMGDGVFDRAP